MPKVNIDHTCQLTPEEAFSKLKSFFDTDQDLKKFDANMQSQFVDSALTGKVKGAQFNADFSVKQGSTGSVISVIIDLPLMLTPFKAKIQETIQRKLTKYLA